MKNICFFNTIVFWGGGEKLLLDNALQFRKRHYNVVMVSDARSELARRAQQEKFQIFPVRAGNLSFLNPVKLVRLASFFTKTKIDVVVFTASQDAKLGGFAARMAGVKKIVYLRGLAVPVKASLINRILYKNILTHIIANSIETKRTMLLKLGKHLPESRVRVVYHGINIEKALKNTETVIESLVSTKNGIVLGTAGRLTRQKGQVHLLHLASVLRDRNVPFTLFVAGTGELEGELTALIEQLHLQEYVKLLGFVEDMNAFMNSIDIFLLASEWEGFGFVLVEAMIKSKPVIAFNMTSNPEIISEGKTGFLIPYGDIDTFAKKTRFLIEHPDERSRMGDAARQSVIERFDIEKITDDIIRLLRNTDEV